MADFRKRLFSLTGVAIAFAGVAFGQATCANPISAGNFVRTEDKTALLADLYVTCTAPAGGVGAGISGVTATPAVTNVTMYLNLPITSKTMSAAGASPVYSEALIGTVAAGAITPASSVQGIVNGTQVTFLNVPTPATAGGGTYQLAITNVRVDATSISSTTPTPITATLFINTATGAAPLVGATVLSSIVVAFAQNGLTAATVPTTGTVGAFALKLNNYAICTANDAIGFEVQFGEAFPNAFKVQTAANATLGAAATNNTETGYIPAAWPGSGVAGAGAYAYTNGTGPGGSNVANSATRVQITYANVPSGVSVYVPLGITTDTNFGPGTLILVNSATATTGAGNTATATTDTLNVGGVQVAGGTTVLPAVVATPGYGKLTVSGGTAVAVYEITAQNPGATDKFTVQTYIKFSANAVPASSVGTAMTATVSFAPVGAAAGTIPNFAVGSLSTPQNASVWSLCSTTLLFPYVINALGFDTGIAIANTSNDLLASGPKSSATNQAGTCTLTFWGNGATNPAAVTTASIASGGTYAANLSSLAAGFAGGYMLANCNFLFGHGFAYISYALGSANGVSMGYLADTIGTGRAATVVAPEITSN